MTTNEAVGKDGTKNAFHLKTRGAFAEALYAYAEEYAQSLRRGNTYVSEISFEQMFDVVLLMFLKEERLFESKKQLLLEIEARLSETLREREAYDRERFSEYLGRCRKKLLPRGRAQTPFSVTPALLLANERRKLVAEQ